jgi:hypothetical protein
MSREHLDWLLEQSAESARTYLALWEKAKALPEGDEHDEIEGEMMAWLLQLGLDAHDGCAEHDAWLDSLPDDQEESPRDPAQPTGISSGHA